MFWSKNRTKIFKAILLIWSSHPLVSFHYFRIWSQIILGELLVLFSSTFHLQIFFLKCSGQKTEPKYLRQFYWYEVLTTCIFPIFQDMETAAWESMLEGPPEQLSAQQRDQWLEQLKGVALSSDAFFPFRDNIDRAYQVRSQPKKI